MFRFCFILFFCFNLFSGIAQTTNWEKAYILSGQLRMDQAQSLIKEKNPAKELLYSNIYQSFIKCLIVDDKASENNFFTSIELYEKNYTKHLPKLYYQYFDGQINLFKSLLFIKNQSYFDAAINFKKAYVLQQQVLKADKNFAPALLSMGIMHSLVATTPDKYLTLTKLIGFEGSFALASFEIDRALELSQNNKEYKFLNQDALFVKVLIETTLLKNTVQVLKTRKELLKVYKGSPVLVYALYKSYEFTSDNDSCIEVLLKAPKDKEVMPFYYLDYLVGSSKLCRLDDDAGIYLMKFLNEFPGNNYKEAAKLKLAWYYLLKNDQAKLQAIIGNIQKKGSQFSDEDKRSVKEIKYLKNTNANLLRSRLLFDGGYYKKSLNALDLKNASSLYTSFYEKMELTYRLGRIYHGMGNLKKAKDYYDVVIKGFSNSEYYFNANAALLTGEIYEKEKDVINAEKYYRLSISCKNHDYENSIEQKAKAGLSRLKK